MVIGAEQREVVEARLTAVRPMFDVMSVDIARLVAAREGAPAIAGPKRAFQCRRDGAPLASDVERRAVLVLNDRNQAAVAGQAPDRLDREIRSTNPSAEGFFVDVHDDLVVICEGNGFFDRAVRR